MKAVVPELAKRVRGKRVAVGLSGGVDSAVSALLLQKAGADVSGVFAHTWDKQNETLSSDQCELEHDYRVAYSVAQRLRLPLERSELVQEYWTDVFEPFLHEYQQGRTPNPDLECNRSLKFGSLLHSALKPSRAADLFATGHYARLQFSANEPTSPRLLRGIDPEKDQSYFLARTLPHQLSHCVFPVGALTKQTVRQIAHEHSLPNADKKGSAGICFIGKRKMADFLSEYIELKPGPVINVDTGETVAWHKGAATLTRGQKAGVAGSRVPYYVAWKDGSHVYAAPGYNHPALYTRAAIVDSGSWLVDAERHIFASAEKVATHPWQFQCKPRYRHPDVLCSLQRLSHDRLLAVFADAVRAVTPGQALVLYTGERCNGACTILQTEPLNEVSGATMGSRLSSLSIASNG